MVSPHIITTQIEHPAVLLENGGGGFRVADGSGLALALADLLIDPPRARGVGSKARERFRCRRKNGRLLVPSESIIRNCLVRVDPEALDRALQQWNATQAEVDESLAIDGKTMRNAIDEKGNQIHVMGVVGHQTKACHTQKK